MNIGIVGDFYPHQRNINGKIAENKYIYANKTDLFTLKKVINKKLKVNIFKIKYDDQFKFKEIWKNKEIDVYHFFNSISLSSFTPWVTSCETLVPRLSQTLNCHHGSHPDYAALKEDKEVDNALNAIADKSCLGILPLSECSKRMQLDFLKHFPKYAETIQKKTFVTHPPQKLLVKQLEDKKLNYSGKLRFLFVGGAFHRKGGVEMYNVFNKLRHLYDFELIIVSSFARSGWAKKESEEDVIQAKELIKNSSWIQYYNSLPNNQVLELMKNSHIGLLPTWAETYGFSVLEMQASGCPVITTDIRALPEINNNDLGWIINIPKNRLGEAIYTTTADRAAIAQAIENGLEKCLIEIFKNQESIQVKAEKCLTQIKVNHSPEAHANKLKSIYSKSRN
ncbi:glycosyltransferase family 4 protein [Adhaeribacter pallidiroseus]|uniref:Glycosyl transferase family 1 domain-containing protein n=1 Tax=Adhaeribacter pallidiroseus TaxID=2072847 RepID=A0A369QMQ8_9BACT|nr:glycosyltransferase family 4 protein [Adhaeribacter pallidiroseus]RDC66034.1 hypothetical protein AHMF7616_04665 [Adhaeribacter pallidiroseus]